MSWITLVAVLVTWLLVGLGMAYLFGRFIHGAEMPGSAHDLAPPVLSYMRRTKPPARAARTESRRGKAVSFAAIGREEPKLPAPEEHASSTLLTLKNQPSLEPFAPRGDEQATTCVIVHDFPSPAPLTAFAIVHNFRFRPGYLAGAPRVPIRMSRHLVLFEQALRSILDFAARKARALARPVPYLAVVALLA